MTLFRWANLKIVLMIMLLVGTLAATAFVFWSSDILGPTEQALAAYQTDGRVTVTQEDGLVTFGGADVQSSTAFIFYPATRVDYRSYAPPLREVAARGYFVVLMPMPLNLAILHINAADQVIAKYPQIEHWAIGGHSLGGMAAANYAENHPVIKGLVLWASFPLDDSLAEKQLKVLSLYGSNDAVFPPAKIEASRALLPVDSSFVEIDGGNHSQFGSYGSQAADGVASISPEEQWAQVVEATVTFLESLSNP